MRGEPYKKYELPLWEVNHSVRKLKEQENLDWLAYKLGYEMNPQSVNPDKQAYKHFSREYNITDWDYIDGDKVALTMDFNRYPQTCALGQKHGNIFVVFDEVVTDNATTTEQALNVVAKLKGWGIHHVYLYGDATSNQRSGKFGRTGKNDWDYVREVLTANDVTFTSKIGISNPKRTVRVDKVNNVIYNPSTHDRRLLINERCQWVIKDYSEAIVNEDGEKIDNGKIGHISDAVDYWVFSDSKKSRGLIYAIR